MRPTLLQMKNFMSHERTILDLSDTSLGIIVGGNGAGKSTILQAITYALWGQVRTGSHNDIVRRGRQSCIVRLTFMVHGQEYQVTRRRHLKGKGKTDLEFTTGATVLTGHTIKQTQAEIDGALGMSYELFGSSALLQQGDADRFSSARPGERKELLAEMLGLGWFQRLEKRARAHHADTVGETRRLNAVVDITSASLDELGQHDEPDMALLESKRDLCQEELERGRLRLADLRKTLADLAALQAEHGKLKEREQAYVARIAELEGQIAELEAEQLGLSAWPCQESSIRGARKGLRQKAERKQELDAVAHLQDYADKYNGFVEELTEAEEAYNIFLTELEAIKLTLLDDDREIDALAKAIEKMRKSRTDLETRLRVAESQFKEMRKRKDQVTSSSTCPTCLQEIEDRESLLASMDSAMEKTEADIWAMRTELSETDEEECRQLIEFANNEDLREGNDTLREALEKDLTRSQSKIEIARSRVEGCNEAREKLKSLSFDPEEYAQLAEDVKQLPEAESQYAQMEAGLERLETVDKALEKDRASLTEGQDLLAELKRQIDMLEEEIVEYDSEEWRTVEVDNLDASIADKQAELTQMETAIATAKERDRQRQDLLARMEETQSELELANKKTVVADLLVRASSKAGAQALLIEAALPQIEHDANKYLEHMSPGIRLLLNTQRETLSGSATETLDIVVYAGGHEAPIETLSGGERFRADLALRLAIGQMLSRRSGTRMEMLAIDEGFGSQDATGQQAIVDAVSSLTSLFSLILVISHVRSVADALGSQGDMIEVDKVGGKSVVKVT